MKILKTLTRYTVDGLDGPVELFETLSGETAIRSHNGYTDIAIVGGALFAVATDGPVAPAARAKAVFIVDDLDAAVAELTARYVGIIVPATDVPLGRRLVAEVADGELAEFMQLNAESAAALL
ncbi:hypothetical protein J2S43_001217 [Catenuloplanes nepalensis]|uniref:VOC domain-containing protein n=1 Tax=Catenuloplanes nepalensis TaxID=587533 RepID=A0ABT9MMR3_9ACTN|nr:hypothetical protein [Catenuloplanes nepalensis]MDP9792705.1 hypothetical protein [Catenuloplanes nepalensis]